jgi:hypothetical protein
MPVIFWKGKFMDKSIKDYEAEMQACIDNVDTEAAHGWADDLLTEFILQHHPEAKKFLELYSAVEKWYA